MDFLKKSISTIDNAIEINKLKSDREDLTNKILHLCTFETPTCRRFMSAKVGSICAFYTFEQLKRHTCRSSSKETLPIYELTGTQSVPI